MVKPLQRAEIKMFNGGLVTDAPALQYPENASIDEVNFDNNIDGTRSRRKGMDVVGSTTPLQFTVPSDVSSEAPFGYLWDKPGGRKDIAFYVVGTQGKLFFYDARYDDLFSHEVGIVVCGDVLTSKFSFAEIQGNLVVLPQFSTEIYIVEYRPSSSWKFITTQLPIRIRDMYGLADSAHQQYETDPNFRGPVTPEQYYNLSNQGWALGRLPWDITANTLLDPIQMASEALTESGGAAKLPSNADTVWQAMDTRPVGREQVGTGDDRSFIYTSAECFNPKLFKGSMNSGEPAAKGFFIIDAFRRGETRHVQFETRKTIRGTIGNTVMAGFTFPEDITASGPSVLCSHAGRLFVSGVEDGRPLGGDSRSPHFGDTVFFSQIPKNTMDLGKYYQEGDPTSREGSDVVDTDGGLIRIAGASNIVQMQSVGKRLLVFAENGVWSVSGGERGFTATSYSVEKLSNYGCISGGSVAQIGEVVFYWGADSIYQVAPNQFGDLEITDIGTMNIGNYYKKVSAHQKRFVRGFVDLQKQVVHWCFYRGPNNSDSFEELRFSVLQRAFTPYKVALPNGRDLKLIGMFAVPNTFNTPVSGIPTALASKPNTLKYVWARGEDITIFAAEYINPDFEDWAQVYGVGADAHAYLETGSTTFGDVAVKKQVNYITMVFRNKEVKDGITDFRDSSCIGYAKWDFADRAHSNRWSNPMQFYRKTRAYMGPTGFEYDGTDLLITKNRIRGHGQAVSLRLETEPKKDCHIVGWSLTLTGNGVT